MSFVVSAHEEVGHGGSTWAHVPSTELIVVDMAVVADNHNSSEHHVTICHKEMVLPFSKRISNRLQDAADAIQLEIKDDVFRYYVSDGTAAWHAGYPGQIGLIGPGVHASHAYERTHQDCSPLHG